jgi:hypothetical protein
VDRRPVFPFFIETYSVPSVDDNSGELDAFTRCIAVEIKLIEDEGMSMEFDVIGVLASVANALRRALLVEVKFYFFDLFRSFISC